jgi:NDP-sugar pyrophosphorylase family protein
VNVIGIDAMKHVVKGKHLDMPDLVLKVHASGGRVKCYREECRWLDIGRMDDYALAQEEFSQNEEAFLNVEKKKNRLDHGGRRVLRRALSEVPKNGS